MAFLCISLNNSSVNTIHILDGDLLEIDKYTIKYDSAKDILKEFPEKIEELKNRYNLEDNLSDIKLRIFLPNDKEQFVMYKKHFVAFKFLIQQLDFLKYIVENDNTIFKKEFNTKINEDKIDDINESLKEYLKTLNEEELYILVRKICEQYDNYLEDYGSENSPSIEDIYNNYSTNNIELPKKTEKKNSPTQNPFAVFEHPKFFKVYGKAINTEKNVIILGANLEDETIYKELYASCKKCFSNNIYCPLNSDLIKPLDDEIADMIDDSVIVVAYIKDTDKELIKKINYASSKNITVLVLTNSDELTNALEAYYEKNIDNVIVKKYIYNDYNSLKLFSDIMIGFYINNYKRLKENN